ncbi:MAG TPA: hypothetical protein EYG73_02350 [Arcobacter sp.]|nr:hypothetical protein [Arcobacter sp.]
MRTGLRITGRNIHLLADEVGVSTKDLHSEMLDAKFAFRREQDKRWAYEFFGKDEKWYSETMQKIRNIRESLPSYMNPIEATIKQYGWIEKNGKKELSMPMMYNEKYPEYAHAVAVEYILTNLSSYHSAMNWN